MPDRGVGIVKISSSGYYGLQQSTSVITTESGNTSALYISTIGKSAPNFHGIIPLNYENPYNRGTVKINNFDYRSNQTTTTLVPTSENSATNSTYLSTIGKSALSFGIIPTQYDNIFSRSTVKNNYTNYSGNQTNSLSPTTESSVINNFYINAVGKTASSIGFYFSSTEAWRGNEGIITQSRASINTPYSQTQLNTALSLGVRYYTMWGLDVGNVPRSWTVTNQPDTTGSQSGYSMNTSTIRIINIWIT